MKAQIWNFLDANCFWITLALAAWVLLWETIAWRRRRRHRARMQHFLTRPATKKRQDQP